MVDHGNAKPSQGVSLQAWKTIRRAFESGSELEEIGKCDKELKINALIRELWKRGSQVRYENMQLLIMNYISVCSYKEGTGSFVSKYRRDGRPEPQGCTSCFQDGNLQLVSMAFGEAGGSSGLSGEEGGDQSVSE